MSDQITLIELPTEYRWCAAAGGQCDYEIREKTAINGAVHHVPTCVHCGHQKQPVPKPGNENKRREGTANWKWIPYLRSLHADGKLHCVLCDMIADEPGGHGEVHHIVPIRAHGGTGQDVESNVMWVCTACHQIIHAERSRIERIRDSIRRHSERRALVHGKESDV